MDLQPIHWLAFGADSLKTLGISPDAFCQAVLQAIVTVTSSHSLSHHHTRCHIITLAVQVGTAVDTEEVGDIHVCMWALTLNPRPPKTPYPKLESLNPVQKKLTCRYRRSWRMWVAADVRASMRIPPTFLFLMLSKVCTLAHVLCKVI